MSVTCSVDAATDEHVPPGFVAIDDNARWRLQGEVTTSTAARIIGDASTLPLPSSGVVDCDGVRVVDSTAVALLLALKRRARTERKPVAFVNVPAPLMALASVYGVAELLVS
jgi:phospholipid transport system transporter-binding protein